MKKPKVVLDTNVLISALVFGGKPRKVLQCAIDGDIHLILSNDLLEELQGVLEGRKFKYPPSVIQAILNQLTSIAQVVHPTVALHVISKDPDDDRVLECALTGRASIIASGDPHLLDLGEFQGIRILTPAQFLEEIVPHLNIDFLP